MCFFRLILFFLSYLSKTTTTQLAWNVNFSTLLKSQFLKKDGKIFLCVRVLWLYFYNFILTLILPLYILPLKRSLMSYLQKRSRKNEWDQRVLYLKYLQLYTFTLLLIRVAFFIIFPNRVKGLTQKYKKFESHACSITQFQSTRFFSIPLMNQ